MTQALISTIEPRYTGYRVAQVVDDTATFAVTSDFYWTPCANTVVADWYWYDPVALQFNQDPIYFPVTSNTSSNTANTGP